MEPLDGAVLIVTTYHFSKGNLLAETIGRLVWIDRHIQDLLRHWQVGIGMAWGGCRLILLLLLLLGVILDVCLLLVLWFLLDSGDFFFLLSFRLR